MGFVIEPGSINCGFKPPPLKGLDSVENMLQLQVTVRLQTGRAFRLRGQGPGQMGKSRIRRLFFRLRYRIEKMMIPME
jgi:hypothetical protein